MPDITSLSDGNIYTKDDATHLKPNLALQAGQVLLRQLGHTCSRTIEHGVKIRRAYGVLYYTYDKLRELVKRPHEKIPMMEPHKWDGASTFAAGNVRTMSPSTSGIAKLLLASWRLHDSPSPPQE